MTKNYDSHWSWPARDIPVIIAQGPLTNEQKDRVSHAANPFSEMKSLIEESLAHPPAGIPPDQLEYARSLVQPMLKTIGQLSEEAKHAGSKDRISFFPIGSAGPRYTADGTAFRKTKVEVFAESLKEQFGIQVATGVRQLANANRSKDSAHDMRDTHCYFEGAIEPGRSYIIVDDCVNSGRTVRDAARYIELNGGRAAGVICQSIQINSALNGDMVNPRDIKVDYRIKPDAATMEKFRAVFPNQALVDSYLGKASLSVGQLTDFEVEGLVRDFESSRHSNPAVTPKDYLERKTAGWKMPQNPAPVAPVPENTPTDIELAKKHPGFFGKGSVLLVGNTMRDASPVGEKLRKRDSQGREIE